MSRPRWQVLWIALGLLLLVCAAAHCSATVHAVAVDSGVEDSPPVSVGDTGSPTPEASDAASDAKVKTTIQGVGSKCLTVCPMHLTCDPYKWKGFCTKTCSSDSDCQGTGDPPVVGVCASDGLCYKACDPATGCTRTLWTCVGDPGHTYCDNFYDAHYYKPGSEGGEGGDDGGTDATDDSAASPD